MSAGASAPRFLHDEPLSDRLFSDSSSKLSAGRSAKIYNMTVMLFG